MPQKPSDFLLGVVDFFAIILPGAMLSYMVLDVARCWIFGPLLDSPTGDAQAWALFFFSSYLLGHFVSLIGALVLDKFVYDPIFRPPDKPESCACTRGKVERSKWYRILDKVLANHATHQLLWRAEQLKTQFPDYRDKMSNTFQWARHHVRLQNPDAAADVDRLEADSKFFRGISVVLLLAPLLLIQRQAPPAIVLAWLLLLLASLWRYTDLRQKCVRAACLYYIALHELSKPPASGKASASR